MSNPFNRRRFLKTSALMTAVVGAKSASSIEKTRQEYYELRVYRTTDSDKKDQLEEYLKDALIPALGRMGIDRIGVFINRDKAADHSIYMLIPYSTLEIFGRVNATLLGDEIYQNAAKNHFAAPTEDPAFTRIHSRLYKAFVGMPVIEMPAQTASRMFEFRIYEAHTEDKAALKVEMFNQGEIQVMRDSGLAPVFFGEALIGDDVPNMAYITSAPNREAHEMHWKKFRVHPEWLRLKNLPKYKDTVSKKVKIFLIPTSYSQI